MHNVYVSTTTDTHIYLVYCT